VPRQAVLQHAAGNSYGDALGQVLDPSKVLSGQGVVQKQLPELINRSPAAAAGVGTALELADPLMALGGAKRGLGAAVGLGEVGEAGWRVGKNLPGATRMLSPSTGEFKSLAAMPREILDMTPRGYVLPDGRAVADVRGKQHFEIAERLDLPKSFGNKYPTYSWDPVEHGYVRFDVGRTGSIGLEIDKRHPSAINNARQLLTEFSKPDSYVMLDVFDGKSMKSHQVVASEALQVLDNIKSGTSEVGKAVPLEEQLNQLYTRGKAKLAGGGASAAAVDKYVESLGKDESSSRNRGLSREERLQKLLEDESAQPISFDPAAIRAASTRRAQLTNMLYGGAE